MWDIKEGEVLQAEQEVQSHEHGRGRPLFPKLVYLTYVNMI